MASLYANENFPLPVVEALRELGHDVLTIQETGRGGQATPDREVLRLAVNDARAVLTINRRHFVKLHQEYPEHSGIIVCRLDDDFARQAHSIHQAIASAGSLRGQLIRVNRSSTSL